MTGESSGCEGATFTYTIDESPGGVSGAIFGLQWEALGAEIVKVYDDTHQAEISFQTAGTFTVLANYTVFFSGGGSESYTAYTVVTIGEYTTPVLDGPTSVCGTVSSSTYTALNGQAGLTTYAWHVPSTGTITAGGGIFDNTVSVRWNATGNQTLSVSYGNNACLLSNDPSFTTNVLPIPVPSFTEAPLQACAGTSGYVYTTQPGRSAYQWTVSSGGTKTSGGGTSNNSVTVTWNTAGTQSVSVNYLQSGCGGLAPAVANVTVNQKPVPSFTAGPVSVCSGTTGNVYSTQAGMTNYQWIVSPGGTVTSGGGTNSNAVTVTWNNSGAQSVSVGYTSNGCASIAPATRAVTVNTSPSAYVVSSGPSLICEGGTVPLHAFFEEGYTYQWQKNGSVIPGATGQNYNATEQGEYSALMAYNGCSKLSDPVNVVTGTRPVATITPAGPTAFCHGQSVVLNGSTGTDYNYQWRTQDGNIQGATSANYTATKAGTYTLVTTIGGCASESDPQQVTVYTLPAVQLKTSGPAEVCAGESITLFTTGQSNSYQWKRGSTIITGEVTDRLTTTQAGTYKVVVANDNCTTETNGVAVVIKPIPATVTAVNGVDIFPAGDRLPYTITANPNNDAYVWATPAGTDIIYDTEQRASATIGFNYLGEKLISVTAIKDGCESLPFEKVINVTDAVSLLPSDIPEAIKVTPSRQRVPPRISRQMALNTFAQEEIRQVFETCPEQGEYYVAFQLSYDPLSDRNTIPNWTAIVDITLTEGADNIQWTRSMQVDMASQTFISTIFHDEPINCLDDYRFRIKTKATNINGVQAPEQHIYLKVLLYKKPVGLFNPADEPVDALDLDYSLINGQFQAGWSYSEDDVISGYDLEWVFIETHELFNGTAEEAFQYKEPVRVTTTELFYSHQLHYPEGQIFVRARAVGLNPQHQRHRIPGRWFYGSGEPLPVGNPTETKNWQMQTVFAEEGKYKKVLSYFDGSLRQRQVQTNLSTDDQTLIGETLYDFEGRKAVDILPAPVAGGTLAYKPALHTFTGVDPVIVNHTGALPEKFHYDNRKVVNSVLAQSAGAGQYYSEQNTIGNTLKDYVPDADGYVYSQTEYLNDGTGRVSRQAGVGAAFKMDGDHITKNYYTEASRTELVRLFGTNVGDASHYKKTITVDPNGQVSVSYAGQEGRVIATALAGTPPASVDALPSHQQLPAAEQTIDLNSKNERSGTVSQTVHRFLNEVPATDYTFSYDLSSMGATIAGFECKSCVYDVSITITAPDGVPVAIPNNLPGNEVQPDAQNKTYSYIHRDLTGACGPSALLNAVDITVTLQDIGDYTLSKTLTAHELTVAEIKDIVATSPDVQDAIAAIQAGYVIDPENCDICTTCPEGGDLIDEVINEIAALDCENIRQEIILKLKQANAADPEYEPTEEQISGHPLYCSYELCMRNMASAVFEKKMARVEKWSDAVLLGYDNIVNVNGNTPDPFFTIDELSGSDAATRQKMQDKINHVGIDGTPFTGSLAQVTNPEDVAYRVDAYGQSSSTGYHVLFYELMTKRGQMGEPAYSEAADKQRWVMFRNLYMAIKDTVMWELPEYSQCPSAREAFKANDRLPPISSGERVPGVVRDMDIVVGAFQGVYDYRAVRSVKLVQGFTYSAISTQIPFKASITDARITRSTDQTTAEVAVWGQRNGVEAPISDAELESHIASLALRCGSTFSTQHIVDITGHLRSYFNGNLKNSLRLIFQQDLGTTSLVAVQSILNSYNCNLALVAVQDPISCAENINITYENLVPGTSGCGNSCPGWQKKGGTVTFKSNGDLLIASACGQAAVMATLVHPLTAGKVYALRFKFTTTGAIGNHIITLSSSTNYGPGGNPLECGADNLDVQSIDRVLAPGTSTQRDRVWQSEEDASEWRQRSILFTTTTSSRYLFIEQEYYDNSNSNIYYRDIEILELDADEVYLCRQYDPNNPTLQLLTYNVDWAQEVANCNLRAIAEREFVVQYAVDKYLESQVSQYNNIYRANCINNATENLRYSYTPREYHYTLYYYDQAGNLVQTVPPKGVRPLSYEDANNTQSPPFNPPHILVTNYRYDSWNQLVWQSTPDAGVSQFFYNQKGQLRLSRNAQQTAGNKHAYTKYDQHGRIAEVGELTSTEVILPFIEDARFPATGVSGFPAFTVADITRTYYDNVDNTIVSKMPQQHLRGRVSWVEVFDRNTTNKVRTHYSYDPHGNVKSLIQQVPGLEPKRTDYVYDLISNKITYVFFQYGKIDQFIHRYFYDADNRIREVETSSDAYLWNKEAKYDYYAHGPLARTELGRYRVQGQDYYYTLQGWIKGVNMPFAGDPGKDGLSPSIAGKDVYAYTLGYYQGDYTASNPAVVLSDTRDQQWARYNTLIANGDGLYNGNIALLVTDLAKIGEVNNDRTKGMQAMLYKYDQLHRIKKSRSLAAYAQGTGFAARTATPAAYDEDYTYDANGNIATLDRYNEGGTPADDFNYDYYTDTNKLRKVKAADDDYVYDAIGNLVADPEQNVTITWTPYGKVREVRKNGTAQVVTFLYDAAGNRVLKRVVAVSTTTLTHYVRDGSGNVMGVYTNAEVIERPVYGSSRLGHYKGGVREGHVTLGKRNYELSNHLGNVLAVITDNIGMQGTDVWAKVVQTSDYYPFGLEMNGRGYADNSEYRYGFNGKEKDEKGEFGDTHYDYGFRIYNPRIGRFLSEDPLTSKYPELTPYQFASNTPIWAIDVDGLEAHVLSGSQEEGFNLSYDWNAKPLGQGQVYFNGSAANISDLSSQYEMPFFNPTPFPKEQLGDPNYYQWRNDDYNVRAGLAGDNTPAPEYYLNYGDKYIKRFTYETSWDLSRDGNQWLGKARYNLQALMQEGLESNPAMERDNLSFQKFAFESHVPAYVNAGVLGLDFLDKTYILTTPDAKDLLSDLGKQQAQAVMKLQVKYYFDNPERAAIHAIKLPYQAPFIQKALERKAAKELLKDLYPTSLKTP